MNINKGKNSFKEEISCINGLVFDLISPKILIFDNEIIIVLNTWRFAPNTPLVPNRNSHGLPLDFKISNMAYWQNVSPNQNVEV